MNMMIGNLNGQQDFTLTHKSERIERYASFIGNVTEKRNISKSKIFELPKFYDIKKLRIFRFYLTFPLLSAIIKTNQ